MSAAAPALLTTPPANGTVADVRDTTHRTTPIGQEIVAFTQWMTLHGRSPVTLDQYERDLRILPRRHPNKQLADVTDNDLLAIFAGFPPAGIKSRMAAYGSFYKWAVLTDRLERNPMDRMPSPRRPRGRHYDVYTDTEINLLLDTLPARDAVLVRILLDAGLRKGEAAELQVRNLRIPPDGHGEILIVRGAKGGKARTVSMTRRLTDALRDFLLVEGLAPDDYLWYSTPAAGRRLKRDEAASISAVDRWWNRVHRDTGVRRRRFHMTRHTYATRWLQRGGRLETLSDEMGHDSIETTKTFYVHLDRRDVIRDIEIIESFGEPSEAGR